MSMIECVPAYPFRRILRALIALVCVASLLPAGPPALSPTEQIAAMSAGRRVELRLKTGVVLVGRVGAIQDRSFNLEPDRKGGSSHQIAFEDVYSVKIRSTVKEKWIIGITIYLLLAGLSVLFGG